MYVYIYISVYVYNCISFICTYVCMHVCMYESQVSLGAPLNSFTINEKTNQPKCYPNWSMFRGRYRRLKFTTVIPYQRFYDTIHMNQMLLSKLIIIWLFDTNGECLDFAWHVITSSLSLLSPSWHQRCSLTQQILFLPFNVGIKAVVLLS